jgi:hypothetical protein
MVTDKQPIEYPPLTVLPVADDPERFYVLGSHEWWYAVDLGNESRMPRCECKGFGFRGTCSHMQAARKFVDGGWPTAAEEAMTAWKALDEQSRKAAFR